MTNRRPSIDPLAQYSIKEVCDILNISRNTLRKYTDSEDIVCIRITSREIYYKGSEVLLFWDNKNRHRL